MAEGYGEIAAHLMEAEIHRTGTARALRGIATVLPSPTKLHRNGSLMKLALIIWSPLKDWP